MGSFGSGRWNRNAGRCERFQRLDLPTLRRGGYLEPSGSGYIWWRSGGAWLSASAEHLDVSHGVDAPERQRIYYTTTQAQFGGKRQWFMCPRCRRACGVLYGKGAGFCCRECRRLCYASQYEPAWQRAMRQAGRIRKALGGSSAIALGERNPFPQKPKGMHWAWGRVFHGRR